MKNITKEELDVIIVNHRHWINRDIEGWSSMRADLKDTWLVSTNLAGANLTNANLNNAILIDANLKSACLMHSTLVGANLNDANLKYADLKYACLTRANLPNADLKGANLEKADLTDTYLVGAKNIPYIPMTCPDTGAFVGWKVCEDRVIVKLLIPEDAKRSSATGRKCRCDKAIVLDIEGADIAYSLFYNKFAYRKGGTITVSNFNDDRFVECGAGIHFFINKEEAINYANKIPKKS